MPKGFNENEKQIIKESLIEQGKILFSKYGLQKTSIQDITKKVGIASGSFYKFYSSKEELYFVVLEVEEEQIKKQLLAVDITNETQPKQAIKNLLFQMIHNIETNPLIRQLYLENNIEALVRKLPPEILKKHFDNDSDFLSPLIEKWKQVGVLFTEPPEVTASVLRSLILLTFHQKEIGESLYPQTMNFLIDHIVEGLFKEA